jgi:hypothetical protein
MTVEIMFVVPRQGGSRERTGKHGERVKQGMLPFVFNLMIDAIRAAEVMMMAEHGPMNRP